MKSSELSLLQQGYENAPLYIYQEVAIQENIARFKSVPYDNFSVHFASMANDNPVLLSLLQQAGIGLFVNSRKHLHLGLSCGFPAGRIIFASTGISEATMKLLARLGVAVNIDSCQQLELYGSINAGGQVGIRLNIDEKSKNNVFLGMESRIGLLESEFEQVFEIADRHRLKLNGVHVYLGTDVTSLDDLMAGVDRTLELAEHFADLEFVDFGGGFPIATERFDFASYRELIAARMHAFSLKRGRSIRLILEPGRAMFGNAASFYAQVTDVKTRPDRHLVCLNASASLIPRAMFYEDYNDISVVEGDARTMFEKPVDVTGNTTYSRDFIARKILLPQVKVGDWLQLHDAGSYCYSMITRFLGQEMPAEYLQHSNGRVETIREGEHYFGVIA